MSLVLWLAQALLAALFVFTGISKLVDTPAELVAAGRLYAAHLPGWLIHVVALAELAGALGLVLPAALQELHHKIWSSPVPDRAPRSRNEAAEKPEGLSSAERRRDRRSGRCWAKRQILWGSSQISPRLTPLAAALLALVMAGAVATHVILDEWHAIALPAALCAACAFVAVGRARWRPIAPR